MPVFRKLTPEEANQVKGIGPRKMIEIEYDGYLRDFEAGDSGEAVLPFAGHDQEICDQSVSEACRQWSEPAPRCCTRRVWPRKRGRL